MTNPVVKQAVSLGGVVNGRSGQLFFRRISKSGDGSFYVIALDFYSMAELVEIVRQAEEEGWEGFTDVINLKVDQQLIKGIQQEDGPGCPYHGDDYLKPSKKPGMLFCSAKLRDGSYCSHTQPK